MDSDTNAHHVAARANSLAMHRANWTAAEDPSAVLVELVAAATGRTQTDLEPLQYTVDGDALNAVLESAETSDLTITFTYEDLEVEISSDGFVEVQQ